jgi:hypothetical protein
MTKISGGTRGPGDKEPVATPGESADLRTKEGVQQFREAADKENVPSAVVDSFERAAPQLEKQLKALSGKTLAGRIQFTSEHLAQLAGAFALILKQHPRADRKERARLFARTILKSKRFSKIFDSADEKDLERMFATIAAQLDGSPVFAQLVEEVTEGARKLSLG